jgi:DNA-binding XRE family transcriptional regulator
MTLREARKKKGYTSKFVAEVLGIKQRTLNKKERENSFNVLQLMKLCELYDVKIEELSN